VTEGQKLAFREFAKFVVQPEQQRLVCREGYRPAGAGVSLDEEGCLIKPKYNVDPTEPHTLLEVPQPDVLKSIGDVWRLTKKPANIYLVVDVSGSMQGEKLTGAKSALLSFIDQIEGDRDSVALVAFSDSISQPESLARLDSGRRQSFRASIRGLRATGGTQLYDAVAYAFDKLQQQGDLEHINVIVAMTDGRSLGSIDIVESRLRGAKTSVLIFTVGYGEDADMDVLLRIARMGDGQVYPSDPETIGKLFQLLSAFF